MRGRPSHHRRHPLCPDCGYDVAEQVESGRLRCPECGATFERGEVVPERRSGDWTPWRGFVRASTLLGLRSVLFVPAWAALLWAGGWLLEYRIFTSLYVLVILGLFVGAVYGVGVEDRAGFASGLVTILASAWCFAALAAGTMIAFALDRLAAGSLSMTVGAPWMAATGVIVKFTLLDE